MLSVNITKMPFLLIAKEINDHFNSLVEDSF